MYVYAVMCIISFLVKNRFKLKLFNVKLVSQGVSCLLPRITIALTSVLQALILRYRPNSSDFSQSLNINIIQGHKCQSDMFQKKTLKRYSDEAWFVIKTFVYMTSSC